uniref:MYND-type domain-containing protein n=1 Tax=Esox lucius TaxID=8010 RepID=A0AAY5K2F6_ESOLU
MEKETVRQQESQHCHNCLQREDTNKRLQKCKGCLATVYFSKTCQKAHWKEHQCLCKAVSQLEQAATGEETQRQNLPEVCKVNYLSAKQNKRLISLIGKSNVVKCSFDNIPVSALWDTGAQALSVVNTTKHSVTLGARTGLGHIETVKAVYPAPVQPVVGGQVAWTDQTEAGTTTQRGSNTAQTDTPCYNQEGSEVWDPSIPLDHLTQEQNDTVKKMLREECRAFGRDKDDCIPLLKMHITLKDNTPVQKTYISIPKPVQQEVKEYLQDLINKGWVTKSKSNYSSPIVCLRKKDGSL